MQYLRERVFAEADDGETVGEIAMLLRVSVSYVSKVLSRLRLTGETTARPQRFQLQLRLAPVYEAIRTQLQEQPDATISEPQQWLRQTHQVSASSGLITRHWPCAASGLGGSYKLVSGAGPAGMLNSPW